MGMVLPREKSSSLLLRSFYFLSRLPIGNPKQRLRLFLDLEWIFRRFSDEESCRVFDNTDHPNMTTSQRFFLPYIKDSFSVLDVGCADGTHSLAIAQRARSVTGIDYSPETIAKCRESISTDNIIFVVASAEQYLSDSSKIFDVIFLSNILEHLDDPSNFLLSLRGKCNYIYVEVPDFERCVTNTYRQRIGATLIYSDADHRYEFDREELSSLLTHCGLDIEEREYRHGVLRYWCSVPQSESEAEQTTLVSPV